MQNFVSGLSSYVGVTHPPGMRRVLILGVKDNRTSEAVGHRRLSICSFLSASRSLNPCQRIAQNVRMHACRQLVRRDFLFLSFSLFLFSLVISLSVVDWSSRASRLLSTFGGVCITTLNCGVGSHPLNSQVSCLGSSDLAKKCDLRSRAALKPASRHVPLRARTIAVLRACLCFRCESERQD